MIAAAHLIVTAAATLAAAVSGLPGRAQPREPAGAQPHEQSRAHPRGDTLHLLDVPYLPQSEALCGGAAVAMVMRYWGAANVYAETFAGLVDPGAGAFAAKTC